MPAFDAVIVLAAGASRRMGRPKALLPWRGETLWEAHARTLAPLAPVWTVLGADAERLALEVPPGVTTVFNAAWATTFPLDSVQVALRALPAARRVLVTPIDVVPASASVLAVVAAGPLSCVPQGPDGRDGHPVAIGGARLTRLRTLAARRLDEVLVTAPRRRVDTCVGDDFDDEAAYLRRLHERLATRP